MRRFLYWLKGLFSKKKRMPYFVSLDSRHSIFIQAEDSENPAVIDDREEVKPVEVLHELEKPVSFSVDNLKAIEAGLVRRLREFEKSGITPDSETLRALDICRARMKYSKYAEAFHWKTTTDSKIRDLVARYKLEHQGIGDFIKNIPTEVVASMAEYTRANENVTTAYPAFSIIAPANNFRERDPILLAKSPFGQYYYILCAWDKEVEYVSDLLSEEKLSV